MTSFFNYDVIMTLMDHILGVRTTLARNFRPSWTSLYRCPCLPVLSSFTRFPTDYYLAEEWQAKVITWSSLLMKK